MSNIINRIRDKAATEHHNRKDNYTYNNGRSFTDQLASNDDNALVRQRDEILQNISKAKMSMEDTVLLAEQEIDFEIPAYERRKYGYIHQGPKTALNTPEHQYFFDFMKEPVNSGR